MLIQIPHFFRSIILYQELNKINYGFEDNCVPMENSLTLATALREAGVPFELHIFERGRHGFGLFNFDNDEVYDYFDRYMV